MLAVAEATKQHREFLLSTNTKPEHDVELRVEKERRKR